MTDHCPERPGLQITNVQNCGGYGEPIWLDSMGTTQRDVKPKTGALSRGQSAPHSLSPPAMVTSWHCSSPSLHFSVNLFIPGFFSFLFSVFPPPSSLQCPCPASYLPFPGGSDAGSSALGLVMLLLSCADMPEFALTFALFHQNEMFFLCIYFSGLCLSNLALAIYFSFPYLALCHVLFPMPEQSK